MVSELNWRGWDIPPGNPLFAWLNAGMTNTFSLYFSLQISKKK